MNFFKKIFKFQPKKIVPKKTTTFSPLHQKGNNEDMRKLLIDFLKKEYPKNFEKIIQNSDYGVLKGETNSLTAILLVAKNDARALIKNEYPSSLKNSLLLKGAILFGLDKEGKLIKLEAIDPNSKQGKLLYNK